MLLIDLCRVLVPDQTVVLFDRFGIRLERCYPDEIIARYLRAEVKTVYTSGDEIHINLRYGEFKGVTL